MRSRNIAGIYNYCDRWCERCPFTSKCQNYISKEQEEKEADTNLDFWDNIGQQLRQAFVHIKKQVEQTGGNWEKFKRLAKEKSPDKPKYTSAQLRIRKNSELYWAMAKDWMNHNEDWFYIQEDELLYQADMGNTSVDVEHIYPVIDSLEVIQWYAYFISAKIHRAILGLHDTRMMKRYPVQNDANGSAKVALIAINRSLAAWETIRETYPERTDELLDILAMLSRIRKNLQLEFPKAMEFIRPGFDDPKLFATVKQERW